MTGKKSATPRLLSKVATGMQGFDEISRGGLPRNRTSLVMGGPGTGKTVFALQTLVNAARERKQPGIFVAFEEGAREIFANAATFGWRLSALARSALFFLDARLSPAIVQSGDFELSGMLAILEAKKQELGAGWIVFDGIDVLLALLQNPGAEMREIYRLRDWLARNDLTAIITAKIDGDTSPARELRLHAVHGRLCDPFRPAPRAGDADAPTRDHEISRLGFLARRVPAELRPARHGSGGPGHGRSPARGFDGTSVHRLRGPRLDARAAACSAAAAP